MSRKDNAASRAGKAVGQMFNELASKAARRDARCDTILDAYNRTLHTGRDYQDERDLLLRERGLGTIDE